MANCQVGTCKICSQNSQGNDKRFTDCNATGGSKSSPCGICTSGGGQQDGNGGCNFAGSILVDAIAAIIFFFFWMMQFWLNIATCVYQALKHLYNADRSTQIVAGAIFVLLCGSILIHGMFGKPCRGTHSQHSQSSSPSSSCPPSSSSSSKSKSQAQGSQSTCQSKLRGGFFSRSSSGSKGSGGGGDASVSASISVNAKVKASSQTNDQGGSLKVKLKDSKLSKKTGQLEKTFYLVITDEKKKKLYETSAKFNLPSDMSEKPALMLTTDPIILENY